MKRHRHPSINCYQHHGCRCEGCRQAKHTWQRDYRRRKRLPDWVPRADRSPKYDRPLPNEEVMRLRRTVGLQ